MAITGTGDLALAQAAYDRLARFALRPELYFDQVADVKPTNQSMPGASVTFPIISDLAIASAPLNEEVDITPQSISQNQVTVSLAEYGNAVLTSAALRGESYVDIDPIVANIIGYNAGVSIDEVARNVLKAGTNVSYATGATSRATVSGSTVITSAKIRAQLANLRSNNVPNFNGYYTGFIHPNVSYDLRSETGAGAWRQPHEYAQPGEIWAGELGAYEGFRFIETPRAPVWANAGAGSGSTATLATTAGSNIATWFVANTTTTAPFGVGQTVTAVSSSVTSGTTVVAITGPVASGSNNVWTVTLSLPALTTGTATVVTGVANVYGCLFVGRQALAKAWSMIDGNTEQPHVVPGPITDYLRRFVPWGWYWLGGYGIYRQASIQRLEVGSSLSYVDPGIDQ